MRFGRPAAKRASASHKGDAQAEAGVNDGTETRPVRYWERWRTEPVTNRQFVSKAARLSSRAAFCLVQGEASRAVYFHLSPALIRVSTMRYMA